MNIFTILLTQPLANGLVLFYKILGQNMGLAIIGFSLFLRFVLSPLTRPYMESMKKMREFAPQLDKIKKKHKGDRQKQMQAQADFYKEKGINPGAGCLPYLLQIVVLIAFFNVFTSVLGNEDIVGRFNELLYPPLKFASGESVNLQFLYLDLAKPDTVSIPGVTFALPGLLLILSAVAQFVSAKISSPYVELEEKVARKTEEKQDDIAASMQKSMIYTFPLMTILIGVRFPSALALYWLVFSIFQAVQQYRASGWGGMTPIVRKLGVS